MSLAIPLGEMIFAIISGFVLGSRLRAFPGEGRVRIGYVFGIAGATLLYGAYDFYYYRIGGIVLRRTWYSPGLSGAFLFGMIGIILGRELIGRRRSSKGDEP